MYVYSCLSPSSLLIMCKYVAHDKSIAENTFNVSWPLDLSYTGEPLVC